MVPDLRNLLERVLGPVTCADNTETEAEGVGQPSPVLVGGGTDSVFSLCSREQW